MKSILLFFGVLKTQSAHVHSFLLLVISNCKLLINPRVDSFLSRLSLLKATKNICFFFLLHSTFLFWLKSFLVCFKNVNIFGSSILWNRNTEWMKTITEQVGTNAWKLQYDSMALQYLVHSYHSFTGLWKRSHVIKGAVIVLLWS